MNGPIWASSRVESGADTRIRTEDLLSTNREDKCDRTPIASYTIRRFGAAAVVPLESSQSPPCESRKYLHESVASTTLTC